MDSERKEFEAWWSKWHDPHVGRVENTVKKFAAESAWQARAELGANEKQPNRATDIATALAQPGCERLRDWASIGPVQMAALEEFVALLVTPAPAFEYQRGWDECMALWADHMRRMNEALERPLPRGYANHAHHLYQNVRGALNAAPLEAKRIDSKESGK
jgi:hypothetical protein